jgi:hypothetical protein
MRPRLMQTRKLRQKVRLRRSDVEVGAPVERHDGEGEVMDVVSKRRREERPKVPRPDDADLVAA